MKVGKMVKLVKSVGRDLGGGSGRVESESCYGLVVDIKTREYENLGSRRIAVILHQTGEIQTWPLDSHYKIEEVEND